MQKSEEKRKIPRSRKVRDYFSSSSSSSLLHCMTEARVRLGVVLGSKIPEKGAGRENRAKTTTFWPVFFKRIGTKTTLFWTQKILKKSGLLSPSPLQPDDNWRREGEGEGEEGEGEGEGEGEEGGRVWSEASQATASRLIGTFMKRRRTALSLGMPFKTMDTWVRIKP